MLHSPGLWGPIFSEGYLPGLVLMDHTQEGNESKHDLGKAGSSICLELTSREMKMAVTGYAFSSSHSLPYSPHSPLPPQAPSLPCSSVHTILKRIC